MYSDEMLNLITADGSVIGYAIEIIFPAGDPVRAHTGVGNVVIDGDLYVGVGQMGAVGSIPTESDASPSRVSCQLSGLPNDYLGQALQGGVRGQSARLITLVFTDEGQLRRAETTVQGTVSSYGVTAGDNNTVNIEISDEFEKFEMPLRKFWSDESFRADYPNSGLCRYAAQTADREIQWGAKNDAPQMRYLK